MSQFLIYALHHPKSPFMYVGRSSTGMHRPKAHGRPAYVAQHYHWPVVRWIRRLRESGNEYEISILEEHEDSCDLNDAEKFYITYFKSLGICLLNMTHGGETAPIESIKRAAALRRGKALSIEHRAKLSEARRKRPPPSEATRSKTSLAMKGKPLSASHKEKIAARNRKRATDPAWIAKMSKIAKSRSPEAYAKAWKTRREKQSRTVGRFV